MSSRKFALAAFLVTGALALGGARANANSNVVELRYQDHRFAPARLQVPAGQALTIKVVNASQETIEFESFRLNR